MANRYTVQDGWWGSGSTWNGGTEPTSEDECVIHHKVDIHDRDITVKDIFIAGGSLSTDALVIQDQSYTLTADMIRMGRRLNDDRKVRLDGLILNIKTPSITSGGQQDGFLGVNMNGVYSIEGKVIIDDPGLFGFSAQMQDIKPEGCARAYARKVSNGVRYLNVVVHIRKDVPHYVSQLYRMAENPFQVLAVTNSAVIKGYIEAITPLDSVGKEYRSFRVSIAEGL